MSENKGKYACSINPKGDREPGDSTPLLDELRRQRALDNLSTLFTYQRPTEAEVESMARIRDKAKELAETIVNNTDISSRDAVRAIDFVRAAVMSANASIVLRGTDIL